MDCRRGACAGVPGAMKIAIVLGPFQSLPPVGMGAVEKVWHELAQAFAGAGHDVLLVGKRNNAIVDSGLAKVRVLPLRGYTASASLWRNLAMDFFYSIQVGRRLW